MLDGELASRLQAAQPSVFHSARSAKIASSPRENVISRQLRLSRSVVCLQARSPPSATTSSTSSVSATGPTPRARSAGTSTFCTLPHVSPDFQLSPRRRQRVRSVVRSRSCLTSSCHRCRQRCLVVLGLRCCELRPLRWWPRRPTLPRHGAHFLHGRRLPTRLVHKLAFSRSMQRRTGTTSRMNSCTESCRTMSTASWCR